MTAKLEDQCLGSKMHREEENANPTTRKRETGIGKVQNYKCRGVLGKSARDIKFGIKDPALLDYPIRGYVNP